MCRFLSHFFLKWRFEGKQVPILKLSKNRYRQNRLKV